MNWVYVSTTRYKQQNASHSYWHRWHRIVPRDRQFPWESHLFHITHRLFHIYNNLVQLHRSDILVHILWSSEHNTGKRKDMKDRGSHDGCHTTEPSSLFAWILVVMFCSGLPVKLGYLKDSNAAPHSVTAPAWNMWAINCDILILKVVIHFLAVSLPVVELLNEEKTSLLKLVE